MRTRRCWIVLGGLVWSGSACSAPQPTIGAALGSDPLNAARLAVAEFPATRPVAFDTLLLSEATNEAVPAIAHADALVRTPGMVAVIGHTNSSASLAASPIYNQARVVQIAPTSTAARYADAGPYSFRLVPGDADQGAFLAAALAARWPEGARVALFYVNDDYGRGLRAALLQHLDTDRFRVVFDAPHADEEYIRPPPDRQERVAGVIAAAGAARPQVLVWLGRSTTFLMYLEEIRRRFGAIPIFGGDALGSWAQQDQGRDLWAGVQFVDFLDLDATEPLRAFGARYVGRYGVRGGAGEVLSYDAMQLVLGALADGVRTGEDLRVWLLSLGRTRPAWPGLSGPIAFTDRGEIARPHVLHTIPERP